MAGSFRPSAKVSMPSAFLPTLLRLLTILVVAVGVVAFASHAVPAGGVLDDASILAQTDGDGGHSHDDDVDGRDRAAGHTHGHNPADHSHDTLVSGTSLRPTVDGDADAWRRFASDPDAGHAPQPLDRPPRPDGHA